MPTPPIVWFADKHQGPRADNQDAVIATDPGDSVNRTAKGILLVLCDGVGGEQGGQRASLLASEAAFNTYYAEPGEPQESLRAAISKANQAVLAEAATADNLKNMATTLVATAVVGDKLYVAHVGDSRAYLMRAGALTHLTKDHNWVAEQVVQGLMTPEEARVSTSRNIITRSLGATANHTPDILSEPVTLQPGDRVMLCSDGLHGAVTDVEIASILQHNPTPQKAVAALIKAANDNHTTDNISSIVLNYGSPAVAAAGVAPVPIPMIAGAVGGLVLIIAAIVIIGSFITSQQQGIVSPTGTMTPQLGNTRTSTALGVQATSVPGVLPAATDTPTSGPDQPTVTADLRTPTPTPTSRPPTPTPTPIPTAVPTSIPATAGPTSQPPPNNSNPHANTPQPQNTSVPPSAVPPSAVPPSPAPQPSPIPPSPVPQQSPAPPKVCAPGDPDPGCKKP